jgi:translation elongation factor EF-Tu-like GTPase
MTQPSQPYTVVPILGADGHGKSSLARALAERGQAQPRSIQVDGRTATVFDLAGRGRVWQLVDFPDAATERALLAATQARGAILVVSALDSVTAGTKTSVENAGRLGIPIIAVALTKSDVIEDSEMSDLVTLEVREFLNARHLNGDAIRVIPTGATRQRPRESQREPPSDGVSALLAIVQR